MRLLLPKVMFQVGQELAKNVETDICAYCDAKGGGAIPCARRAARLPDARNVGRAGCAANSRKREGAAAIVVAREQSARDGVPGSPEKATLTGNEVPIVLVQRGGCSILQTPVNEVFSVSVPDALAIRFGAAAPFL